uniref:Uncharacterized protein n=1 Tax=Utricularia reniformis TaxID=192314 RepID=A0A1Y0B3Z6_9LAMI|nr:hypothetical protein AEK19_MT1952 [Utricularia reniformis]ART32114.1 hypothetical protein AEK19_MT1952 [Utricularia reniformis]
MKKISQWIDKWEIAYQGINVKHRNQHMREYSNRPAEWLNPCITTVLTKSAQLCFLQVLWEHKEGWHIQSQ